MRLAAALLALTLGSAWVAEAAAPHHHRRAAEAPEKQVASEESTAGFYVIGKESREWVAAPVLPAERPRFARAPSAEEMAVRRDQMLAVAEWARLANEAGAGAEARPVLEEALERSGKRETEARAALTFQLALSYEAPAGVRTMQIRPPGGSTLPSPEALERRRAIALYEQVLEYKPGSASTHYNLARLYRQQDDGARALDHLRAAAAADDPNRAFYTLELAAALDELERWSDAEPIYRRMAIEHPENRAAHRALMAHYLDPARTDDDALLDYLWSLLAAGQALETQQAALDALTRPHPEQRPEAQRVELLSVLAASLGERFIAPKKWAESADGRRLEEEVTRDPALADGAHQLWMLYSSPDAYDVDQASELFWWWRERGDAHRDPPRGLWPRDALRKAMRAIGDWYQQRSDPRVAGTCYRTAATFAPDELDAAAFRDLVQLYVEKGYLKAVEAIAREYQQPMIEMKNDAYRDYSADERTSRLEKIYDFHVLLGRLFGTLAVRGTRDWGSRHEVGSALFQLERAISVGKLLDAKAAPGSPPHLDPAVVDLLARAYVARGEPERAARLRRASAERLEGILTPAQRQRLLAGADDPKQLRELEKREKELAEDTPKS